MTFKTIFLLASLIVIASASSNRVKRQSPFSMGLRMIEDLRGNMQKTFQNFIGRFRNRNQNEFPSRNPRPHVPPPNFIPHSNFIQQHAPDPVFKTVTGSSFAVFHDGLTPAPLHHNQEFFHFNDVAPPSHGIDHQKRNVPHHENFIHHHNTGQFDQPQFRSSPPIPPVRRVPTSQDGWIALIPSENDVRFPIPEESLQSKQVPKESFQTNKNFPTSFAEATPLRLKIKKEIPSSKEKQAEHKLRNIPRKTKLHKSRNVKRLTESRESTFKKLPIRSRAPEPVYKDFQNTYHETPAHQREDIDTTTEFDFVTNTFHSSSQSQELIEDIPTAYALTGGETGKLINNGLKMKLSEDKEKKMKVNGYEFGYGIVDKDSGNRFYHAEKKDGGKTKGSYKIQLPDGRIQTVDYTADDKGFHPKITYEGDAQFPGKKQVKKYARPAS